MLDRKRTGRDYHGAIFFLPRYAQAYAIMRRRAPHAGQSSGCAFSIPLKKRLYFTSDFLQSPLLLLRP